MTYTGTLTQEQIDAAVADRDEFMRIALLTDRCNRQAAEDAIRAVYVTASHTPPKIFLWADSPMGGARIIAAMKQLESDDTFEALVKAGETEAVLQRLLQEAEHIKSATWAGVRTEVLHRSLYLWSDAYWMCLHRHALKVADLPVSDRLEALIAAAVEVGWWWPTEDIAIVTERPTVISLDDQFRLHGEGGPAIRYADDYSLWAWHGTRVYREVIEGSLTPEQILREPNAEIRRCAIEVMGWAEFIERGKFAQVGSAAPDPGNPGNQLFLYDLPEALYEEPVRVLLCTNGTIERDGTRRRFGLTVPANIDNPVAAAAWLSGVTPELYLKMQRRT